MVNTKSLLTTIIVIIILGIITTLMCYFTVRADYSVLNKNEEKKFYKILNNTDVVGKILQFKVNEKMIKGDLILLKLPQEDENEVDILIDNNHTDRIFKVDDTITVKLIRSIKFSDKVYVLNGDIR
ncbi:hypothetical protein [Leuconostoc litchii]|uniref:Uncharacterized protein n=1 Tax=Leuconostoc litchii TaxID=1981069 RepID=A0A652NDU5_9LACO|nr:hypothetical protein [Leuconostoc litchii]TYC46447.1 hypothetical protein ESZ47_06235 [Leuconostoc litchii]